jgi:7-dehydrocholesterol reductase
MKSWDIDHKTQGQITPAGHLLTYHTNGLKSYIITLALYIFTFRNSFIADHWFEFFLSANIIGYVLAIFAYVKAYVSPTHPNDRKFSNSHLYDFFMGIEFNPRIGDFDFKLFFNGRPGIIAWSIINISFAYSQYNNFGSISNSMVLVNILQAIYVIDFFYNEDWYLRTIDIAHDHFGYMLAWGDCVWLPFLYTLQSQYLSRNFIVLSSLQFDLILLFGLIGYYIFRIANWQKDTFRQGKLKYIWDRPIKYISAHYTSSDGASHTSKLLLSGCWGITRHCNYLGDLMMALSYGLACGFGSFIPYFYFVYMCILLIHRCYRDEDRCSNKYGNDWNLYCKMVKYRIIPFIF